MGASPQAGISNDCDSCRRLTSCAVVARPHRARGLSIFDHSHLHHESATFDLGTQCPSCLFCDPVFEDSLSNFVEGWNSTLYSLVNPDQVCTEGGFDGTDPEKRSFVFDVGREGGPEPSGDSIRRGSTNSMTRKKGIGEFDGGRWFDVLFGEFSKQRGRVDLRPVAPLVARKIDVGEVEEGGLTPVWGGALVVRTEDGLVGSLRSDARADHCLNAIDESALDDGIALVHPEVHRLPEEFVFGYIDLAFEESHVENEALSHDRVGFVKAECSGLLEPKGIFDDLILDRTRFHSTDDASRLILVGGDSLIDFATQNLDQRRFRDQRLRVLQSEQQDADEQKVDEG